MEGGIGSAVTGGGEKPNADGFKLRIGSELRKYQNLQVIAQRLELQGFLDELHSLLKRIKSCEDQFTISELKRIQNMRVNSAQQQQPRVQMNQEPFDFDEQYANNSQIFLSNMHLIMRHLVQEVWQDTNNSSSSCMIPDSTAVLLPKQIQQQQQQHHQIPPLPHQLKKSMIVAPSQQSAENNTPSFTDRSTYFQANSSSNNGVVLLPLSKSSIGSNQLDADMNINSNRYSNNNNNTSDLNAFQIEIQGHSKQHQQRLSQQYNKPSQQVSKQIGQNRTTTTDNNHLSKSLSMLNFQAKPSQDEQQSSLTDRLDSSASSRPASTSLHSINQSQDKFNPSNNNNTNTKPISYSQQILSNVLGNVQNKILNANNIVTKHSSSSQQPPLPASHAQRKTAGSAMPPHQQLANISAVIPKPHYFSAKDYAGHRSSSAQSQSTQCLQKPKLDYNDSMKIISQKDKHKKAMHYGDDNNDSYEDDTDDGYSQQSKENTNNQNIR